MKKLFLSVCLFVFSSNVVLSNTQELEIEFSNCGLQEKEFFIKSYSYLYEDIKDKMVIADMNAELEKRFNEAKVLVDYGKAVAIKASKGENILAFAVLDKISMGSRLRILRSAFDLSSLNEEMVKTLIGFIQKTFPTEKILEVYIIEDSNKEANMLKKFGFVEFKLNDTVFTCFEFKLSE